MKANNPADCVECRLMRSSAVLREACASTGMENGFTAKQEMDRFIEWYHVNKHLAPKRQRSRKVPLTTTPPGV